MDKKTFVELMQPCVDYYREDLSADVWKFYYEELGGMTTKELEAAIRRHMASMKSFPKVAHLQPAKARKLQERDTRRYDVEAERDAAIVDAWVIFEAELEGRSHAVPMERMHKVNLREVIDQAHRFYEAKVEEFGDYLARSYCRSGIQQRVIGEWHG